jgi:cytochrome c oxidase cbb3-type subunit III
MKTTLRSVAVLVMPGVLCSAVLAACARQESTPTTAAATAEPASIPYEAHVSAGGRVPVAGELTNPLHGDAAAVKNGAALFTAMNCDGCHGGDAGGWVGPSLIDGRWRYGGGEGEIFNSIYFGRPKGMPAFGGTISVTAVWSLVTYLESLHPPPNVPTESWDDSK